MPTSFFEEQAEQSRVKAAIVEKYLFTWAGIISRSTTDPLQYIDLFAGPGRYRDGAKSTPLLVLEKLIADPKLSRRFVTIFNDRDPEASSTLRREINALPGLFALAHQPQVCCEEVGDQIVRRFEERRLVPTLMFVDPWGYKGLSLDLVGSVLKDWACECVFFFNYNRINMGLPNPFVEPHMAALFTDARATRLRATLPGLSPDQKEATIIEELSQSLRDRGARYVLPFRFRTPDGARTSHHLIFVTKHVLGYTKMKEVMAGASSTAEQGVASFAFDPAEQLDRERQPLLFSLARPLDELADDLCRRFAGRMLTMSEIFDAHHVDTPFIERNYKAALLCLERAGRITADPPAAKRPKKNGEVTFSGKVRVTFPSV